MPVFMSEFTIEEGRLGQNLSPRARKETEINDGMEGVRSAIFEITQLLKFFLSSEDLLLQKVSQV